MKVVLPFLFAAVLGFSASAASAAQVLDRQGQAVSEDQLFDALAQADVVLLGEQHDDAAGHRFELEVLKALQQRGRKAALGMEMFERHQQPFLDAYVHRRIVEADMIKRIEVWSNYKTDYKPLVDYAAAQGWPVVGTDVPRPLAARVSREGLGVLARLKPAEREQVARHLWCPADAYRTKFLAVMQGGASHGGPKMNLPRLYQSQCVKDETMAESVAAMTAPGLTVVHVNGAFHTDGRLGITPRIERRKPGLKVVVVSIARLEPGETLKSRAPDGDYVVLP